MRTGATSIRIAIALGAGPLLACGTQGSAESGPEPSRYSEAVTGDLNPPGPDCGQLNLCQKVSTTDISGSCCSCPSQALYEGTLVNDNPIVPSTYFCRECLTETCSKVDPNGIYEGRCCSCSGRGINRGILVKDEPILPSTAFCR